MDLPAGNFTQFKQRSLDNYNNRCLHHYVYSENLLRGARIGAKLWKNMSLLVDVHDVFYDTDLTDSEYKIDLIRTASAEIEFRF